MQGRERGPGGGQRLAGRRPDLGKLLTHVGPQAGEGRGAVTFPKKMLPEMLPGAGLQIGSLSIYLSYLKSIR